MKKEIADKWVAALRSGKYQQGKNVLSANENSFCCLGVLCDVVKDQVIGHWENLGTAREFIFKTADEAVAAQYSVLDSHFATAIGMRSAYPSVSGKQLSELFPEKSKVPSRFATRDDPCEAYEDKISQLAALNDSGLFSFEEIALIIETYGEAF